MSRAAVSWRVWVVGAGRVGRALGTMLMARGAAGEVVYVGKEGPSSQLQAGSIEQNRHPGESRDPAKERQDPAKGLDPGFRRDDEAPAGDDLGFPDLVLLTVRDEQIAGAAAALAARGVAPAVVLHTSGAIGSDVLHELAAAGWATGSMAPVVSISDPERDAEKLIGGWYAVEGDPEAVAAAERIVQALDGHILWLDRNAKPIYHAAAVFASNYIVTLVAAAERLMGEAGVDRGAAHAALAALAAGTLANAAERGAEEALTGPVARGDAETIERHLARLSPGDRRLYSVLALETLEIACRRGLEPAAADRIARILGKAADS